MARGEGGRAAGHFDSAGSGGVGELGAVLDAAPVMLRWLDASGGGCYFNKAWLTFTGRQNEEESGEGWTDSIHPEDIDIWRQTFTASVAERRPFTAGYRLRRADGAWRLVADNSAPLPAPASGRGYVVASIDVTEASEREGRARHDLGLYYALAETIPALVLTTTADGEVEYANARLKDYCGTDVEGLSGARWADFIHPDDVRTGREAWTRRVARQEPFSTEYRIRRHDGVYRWHLTHTAPLRNRQNKIQAWVGVSVDVHDRHEAEQHVLDAAGQLQRALDAKDEFLGLISHELRTPITTIYGNAQVLRRMADRLDPTLVQDAISDAESEAIRLQQLVDNMFVLARLDAGADVETEPVLLGRVVARTIADHQVRYPLRRVDVRDEAGQLPARGAPVYVEQILRNLLSNAEKYSPPEEPIVVAINRSADTAAVRVMDRGMGIPAGNQDRVFDTFYRAQEARDRAQGAGIGLTVARRLAEAQGGSVWIQQRDGGGTEACFTLPLEREESP